MGKRPRADKNKRLARVEREEELEQQLRQLNDKANKPVFAIGKRARDEEDDAKPPPGLSDSPMIELTEPKLMSRILYTNPVCILTTCVPNPLPPASGEGDAAPPPSSAGERNAMIVSWLTPGNNEGLFLMAINKKRFSADCFIARRSFVLSVPVKGQEKLVASIGSCSGYKSDKFAAIDGLVAVQVGDCFGTGKKSGEATGAGGANKKQKKGKGAKESKAENPFSVLDAEDDAESKKSGKKGGADGSAIKGEMAVSGCAAHLQVSVIAHSELDEAHWVVTCQAEAAFVHPKFWNGKCFLPIDKTTPPYLTFPGAATFAYVRPT